MNYVSYFVDRLQILMSNTYPGDGGADVYVGSDEFQTGVIDVRHVLRIGRQDIHPTAGPCEVNVLIVEATINESAIIKMPTDASCG
jgi:hypothetical protein